MAASKVEELQIDALPHLGREPLAISALLPVVNIAAFNHYDPELPPLTEWDIYSFYARNSFAQRVKLQPESAYKSCAFAATKVLRLICPSRTSAIDEVLFSTHTRGSHTTDISIAITITAKQYAKQEVEQILNKYQVKYNKLDTQRSPETRPNYTFYLSYYDIGQYTSPEIASYYSDKNFLSGVRALQVLAPVSNQIIQIIKSALATLEDFIKNPTIAEKKRKLYEEIGFVEVYDPKTLLLFDAIPDEDKVIPLLDPNSVIALGEHSHRFYRIFIPEAHAYFPKEEKRHPLHEALWQGNEELVRKMIEENNDLVLLEDRWGCEPIDIAMWRIHQKNLLAYLLSIRRKYLERYPSLIKLQKPYEEEVHALYKGKYFDNPPSMQQYHLQNMRPVPQRPRLHHLVVENKWSEIEKLLDEEPQAIDAKDPYGFTPLLIAVALGHMTIIRGLIARGACTNNYGDYSVIGNANDDEVLLYLLKHHVDPNEYLVHLDRAVYAGNIKRTELLLQYGLKLFKKDKTKAMAVKVNLDGTTTLDLAFALVLQRKTQTALELSWLLLQYVNFRVYSGRFPAMSQAARALEQQILTRNAYIKRRHIAPLLKTVCQGFLMTPKAGAIISFYKIVANKDHPLHGQWIQKKIISTADLTPGERAQIYALIKERFEPHATHPTGKVEDYYLDRVPFQREKNVFIEITTIGTKVLCFFSYSYFYQKDLKSNTILVYSGKVAARTTDVRYKDLKVVLDFFLIPLAMKLRYPNLPIIIIHTYLQPGLAFCVQDQVKDKFFPMYELDQPRIVLQKMVWRIEQQLMSESARVKTTMMVKQLAKVRDTGQYRLFKRLAGDDLAEKLVGMVRLTPDVVVAHLPHAFKIMTLSALLYSADLHTHLYAANSRKSHEPCEDVIKPLSMG